MIPGAASLAVFMVAALALNISPGPDMLYVISRSLELGRRAGVVSALGIGVGTLVYTFVTAIGLSALLVAVPIAFELVKFGGAAYLVYLGIRMLVAKANVKASAHTPGRTNGLTLRSVFRQGVTTNVLNPKVALFFLAFLPQFVDRSQGAFALQMIFLGLLFDTSGTSVNVMVATLAGHVSESLKKRSGFMRFQKLVPASILITLGFLIAVR
ncbi:MAG: LysE family translocator [Candidatus Bathyarchaeia archaeon]